MNFHFVHRPGTLEFSGDDSVNFLQRQTSNDLRKYNGESALVTVLTSPKARILDVLTLLPDLNSSGTGEGNSSMSIVTLPGYSPGTLKFLTQRIFFMDKVAIKERSGEFIQVELIGQDISSTIANLGFGSPPESGMILSRELNGCLMRMIGRFNEFQLGPRLILTAEIKDIVFRLLEDTGSRALDGTQYNNMRIEAGIPREGHELTSDYTPLEVGLEDMVSETKGCYTGQEVIARQINSQKVTKQLCGIKLSSNVSIADRIWIENKSVGEVTSAGQSDLFGAIALAVIKRPHNTPGTELLIGRSRDNAVRGEVVGLPFVE